MAATGSYTFTIGAVDKASSVIDKLNKKLAAAQAPFKRLNQSLTTLGNRTGISGLMEVVGKLGKAALSVGDAFLKILAPLGAIVGLGSVGGIAALASHFASWGSQLKINSLLLDISADKLAHYLSVARLAGSNDAAMVTTLQNMEKLKRDIFVEHDPGKMYLNKELGIGAGDDAWTIYKKVIKKLQDQRLTPEAKTALREATGVDPGLVKLEQPGALEKTEKEADRLNPTSKEDVETADKLNNAFLRLSESVNHFMTKVESAFAPSLTKITDSATGLLDRFAAYLQPRLVVWADHFATWLAKINPDDISGMITKVVDVIGGLPGLVTKIEVALAAIALAMVAGGGGILGKLAAGAGLGWGLGKIVGAELEKLFPPGSGAWLLEGWNKRPSAAPPGGSLGGTPAAPGGGTGAPAAPGGSIFPGGSSRAPSPAIPSMTVRPAPEDAAPAAGTPAAGTPAAPPGGTAGTGTPPHGVIPGGVTRNNPGNLRSWQGAGSEGGFAVFQTPMQGLYAMRRNLEIYNSKHGLDQLSTIINRWAPAKDHNDPVKYAADVGKSVGLDPNAHLNIAGDAAIRAKVMAAMIRVEQGYDAYSKEAIEAAAGVTPTAEAAKAPAPVQAPRQPMAANGKIQVDVNHNNPPAGATATARTTGPMFDDTTPAVATSMPAWGVS